MARPLSHKSPTARTPSFSGHAHSGPQQSTSFHQYSTPLAASAGIDDPVTFSSPSALLALGGYTGISPSPATHDALVGSGINDNDIHAFGMQGLKLGTARDNDEERRRNIEDVVQLLRSRVAGRGVCREGIERLGQLEGFESIWQEDSLSIAGNFVDLETEFHPGKNTVKEVNLNYATPEATEGERREEATAVLRRDLIQSPEEADQDVWKSLAGFYGNLQWLAKLDRLSQEVNCFEAIEDLHESLKRIWEEESKHPKLNGTYEHMCNGWIGRPGLHRGGRIGISLDYWVHQAQVLDEKQKRESADAMVLDSPDQGLENHQHKMWSVMIECEEGYPSLRVSKDWVNHEVLTATNTEESSDEKAASDVPLVNWADPPQTISSVNQGNSDAMALDSGMLGSSAPNRRFVAKIEPPLDIPILAASEIYRNLGLQLPQEFKMVTYDGLLVPGWSPLSATDTMGIGTEESPQIDRRKRRMSVEAYDHEGKACKKQHSYTFQAFESVAGRTMRDIPFSHPRQLAEIIPVFPSQRYPFVDDRLTNYMVQVLRQYASLANMIHRIFDRSPDTDDSKQDPGTESRQQPTKPEEKDGITILSNQNPNEQKLDALLKGFTLNERTPTSGSSLEGISQDDVKVDITLRTQLGQAPVLMLLITTNDSNPTTENNELSRISISLEVGFNGRISVVDTSGLWDDKADEQDIDNQNQKNEASELARKISRALEVSQDLGALVEWVLRWRQEKNSA